MERLTYDEAKIIKTIMLDNGLDIDSFSKIIGVDHQTLFEMLNRVPTNIKIIKKVKNEIVKYTVGSVHDYSSYKLNDNVVFDKLDEPVVKIGVVSKRIRDKVNFKTDVDNPENELMKEIVEQFPDEIDYYGLKEFVKEFNQGYITDIGALVLVEE